MYTNAMSQNDDTTTDAQSETDLAEMTGTLADVSDALDTLSPRKSRPPLTRSWPNSATPSATSRTPPRTPGRIPSRTKLEDARGAGRLDRWPLPHRSGEDERAGRERRHRHDAFRRASPRTSWKSKPGRWKTSRRKPRESRPNRSERTPTRTSPPRKRRSEGRIRACFTEFNAQVFGKASFAGFSIHGVFFTSG